jgi:hypothetical protein
MGILKHEDGGVASGDRYLRQNRIAAVADRGFYINAGELSAYHNAVGAELVDVEQLTPTATNGPGMRDIGSYRP